MKYIRTKDGIGEYSVDWNGASCVHLNHKWHWLQDIEKDIIKQADTIEELCDEFVAENRTGHKWLVYITTETYEDSEGNIIEYKVYGNKYTEEYPHNLINDIKHEGLKIYGAIWTDKGLIYVAKMNEKGELELL